ncbi:hypothetical protein PT447_10865 [Aliarcobacter butzleri]|uniref:hypothetical protein n=1 Tax=Aliarcobacter butzleri TaxID=28197 RepID=UPI0024DE6026|nr:hypothetical protein [Aliarcobacter butzleri]MDK2065427.1 hypothetical protein [Aliarcobacter butzleri]
MNTKEIIELIKNTKDENKIIESLKNEKLNIEIIKKIFIKFNAHHSCRIIIELFNINSISEEMFLKSFEKISSKRKSLFFYFLRDERIENLLIQQEIYLNYMSKKVDMRIKMAEHKNTSSETLDKLADDKEWFVKLRVAEHKNTSSETLDKLAEDKDSEIRGRVAGHKNTSSETLDKLSNDEDKYVIWNIMRHSNTSIETLDKIVEKTDDYRELNKFSEIIKLNENIKKKVIDKISKIKLLENIKDSFILLENKSILDFLENLVEKIDDTEILKALSKKVKIKLENV